MNACHKNLEYQIKPFKNKNSKILEIGAGTSPHFEYVDSQFKIIHSRKFKLFN